MQILASITVFALAALLLPSAALAGDTACTPNREGKPICPAPDARCVTNRTGDVVCSTPGGGIELDRYGDAACGPGSCTKDLHGELFCSSAPRGAASTDRYGKAVCAESCVRAQPQACVRPKPAE